MKKVVLTLLASCLSLSVAYAQKTVQVSTAEEFLNAIASDVIIELKAGKYDLSTLAETMTQGANYKYEPVYDGMELQISNLKNLTIKGKDAEVITQPQYGNVFVFKNCNNVTIEGITAGHGTEKGACVGGVFKFVDVANASVTNCKLYGSGIEGITAENVGKLACKNTDIYECTYGLLTLTKVGQASFDNCTLRDSKEYDLINITTCGSVSFKNCRIANNKTGDAMSYALFNVSATPSVILENCKIENNSVKVFAKDAKSVKLKNTKLNNNQFIVKK